MSELVLKGTQWVYEFAMEGMYATKEVEKNIIDVLMGKRTLDEVRSEIKQKYIKNEA